MIWKEISRKIGLFVMKILIDTKTLFPRQFMPTKPSSHFMMEQCTDYDPNSLDEDSAPLFRGFWEIRTTTRFVQNTQKTWGIQIKLVLIVAICYDRDSEDLLRY